MPALAPIGAAIASAASAVTITGLATGAAIVGTGMQLVGMATGSKTLQKVGMGFSMASGVGFAANGVKGLMNAKSVTGGVTKSGGLLAADNIDNALSTPLKGSKTKDGFATFDSGSKIKSSADSFKESSNAIGKNTGISFDPEFEKSYFQRANETLTQYNPMLGMVGGIGEAYMMNERMDLEKDMLDKRLAFEQQNIDRINRNNGTLLNINPAINLGRDTNAYTGLLRR